MSVQDDSRAPFRAAERLSVLVLLTLAGGARPALAQSGAGEREAERAVLVGVLVGPERVHEGIVGSPCGGRVDGSTVLIRAGAYVQAPLGLLTVEGAAAYHTDGPGEHVCPGRLFAPDDGVHTTREMRARRGDFASTQLAVLLGIGGDRRAVVSAGAGWTWPKNVPYVTGGLGFHVGRDLQVGVDLGLRLYRVPWTRHTAEYLSGQEVRVLADEPYEEWMHAVTVQFSVGFPVLQLGA